jgi:hypothetical protein
LVELLRGGLCATCITLLDELSTQPIIPSGPFRFYIPDQDELLFAGM